MASDRAIALGGSGASQARHTHGGASRGLSAPLDKPTDIFSGGLDAGDSAALSDGLLCVFLDTTIFGITPETQSPSGGRCWVFHGASRMTTVPFRTVLLPYSC
jgi:hypothetical protein